MTVARINKSPFLLICGYNNHKAWGLPKLFIDDKPLKFQAVSQMLYVLTEKSNLYRINCETRSYDQVKEEGDAEMDDGDEINAQITQIACGTDFIVTLRGNGEVYAMGKNASG